VAGRLAAAGADVVRSSRGGQYDTADWVRSDLGTVEEVDRVLLAVRPDVVVHFGGHVSAAPDPALVVPTFTSLLVSSLGLLRAAQEGRIGRLVLVGSTEEPRPGAAPASPYAAAKAAVASYAQLYALWDTPAVVVRPAMVFGAGQAPSKLLPYVARALLRGERPELTSGARLADWVHVDDVVEGFLAALVHAPAGSQLDLGSGRLTSTRELVDRLRAALDIEIEPRWGALPDRPDEPSRAADTLQTERVIGWAAQLSLDEGLRRSAEHWRVDANSAP
jgi:UDP-glucose 4-epimerase